MDFLQGKSFIFKDNEVVSAETALKKKIIILFYFTTLESEACRVFDGKLRRVYQEALQRKIDLGVVVVSCDPTKDSYMLNVKGNYLEWYAVQFDDDLRHVLNYNYGITHVPSLIVVGKSGAIVTRNGTKDIENYGINVLVTWLD